MNRASASARPFAAALPRTTAENALLLSLYLVFAAVTIAPLFWVQVPALVDYPNHLARMWILAQHGQNAALNANYLVEWRVLPDLAMDLVVPPLAHILSIEAAGRVFIGTTMLALIGGTATLYRVLYGRWAILPLWSALFVYNAALFWGFLNCLFGIGAFLFVFAGWIATREWRMVSRTALFAVLASLLLLLHLFAFGVYGLSVALYEIGERFRGRRFSSASLLSLVAAGLQFLPGLALWRLSLEHGGPTVTIWGHLSDKLYALISPFTFGYLPVPFDGVVGLAAIGFLCYGLATRSLKLAPQFRLPLAGLTLTALVIPNVLSGSWSADLRLPVTLSFLVLAAIRVTLPHPRMAGIFVALALAVLGLRVWTVTKSWRDYDREFAEFRSAADRIPAGSRLLPVEALAAKRISPLPEVPKTLAVLQRVAFIHMAALSVIDRADFVPYLFTGWTTIAVAPRNRDIAQRAGLPATPDELRKSADPEEWRMADADTDIYGEPPYWRRWTKRFDYVLWIDFGSRPKHVPRQLSPVGHGSFFEIYRVKGAS